MLVVVEGPGSDRFPGSVAQSDHEFDRWFAGSVADLHGFDLSGPMPPLASRKI